MARARNIKPGFFKNEDLAECSIWARYVFPGLWMMADREGRLEDRPKRIKGEILPYDSQDVEPLLRELAARGFITRYQIEGASFIQITKFLDHQAPHYSEKASVIKPQGFRELSLDDDAGNSGKVQSLRGVRNPLNPDSLNPESPILKPDTGIKTARDKRPPPVPKPDGVDDQVWADWLQLRKTKKAPVTQTVLDGAVEQAALAGMSLTDFLRVWCRRGSQGLEAAWLKPDERNQGRAESEPAWRAEQRSRTQQAVPGIAAKAPQNFIDVETRNVAAITLG
jgi:hypothetical protein